MGFGFQGKGFLPKPFTLKIARMHLPLVIVDFQDEKARNLHPVFTQSSALSPQSFLVTMFQTEI
jgi:hypothetical protein